MAISQLYIPFPDFKLMEIIDPEEHDANNAEIVGRINQTITILNSFINGEANDSLSAMAVHMPAVEPFQESNVEQLFRDLIGRLISDADGLSGADLVGATPVEGLEGNTVQSQLDSLRVYLEALADSADGTDLALGIHKSSGDHDERYYRKTETDAKYTPLVGDHKGTLHGKTIEEILSQSGTGFGSIEVLSADPTNPAVGRIWILDTEADAGAPVEPDEGSGD